VEGVWLWRISGGSVTGDDGDATVKSISVWSGYYL